MNPYLNWLKKVIIAFVLFVISIVLPIISFNYYIDPLWLFGHKNQWNDIQQGFNERQQKVNKWTFSESKKQTDALLLGSSRSTYLNEHDFKGINVYNFAVSSMQVEEYEGYVEYAKSQTGKEFDYIFLGLDFFASNTFRPAPEKKPSYYIENTNSYLYRLKSLASIDTLKKSIVDFQSSRINKPTFIDHRYYSRTNIAKPFSAPIDLVNRRIETNIYEHYQMPERYKYDSNIKDMLIRLKEKNPHTEFIVYTTPITYPRMAVELQQKEYWQGYTNWLTDIVDVFGEVHHFMTVNKVTTNLSNFVDSHHFKPEIGSDIIDHIWNKSNQTNENFGVDITKKNIDESIKSTKRDLKEYENSIFSYLEPIKGTKIFEWNTARFQGPLKSSSILDQTHPFQIVGLKGDFQFINKDSSLLIQPTNVKSSPLIQLGYQLDESIETKSEKRLSVIISLKGLVKNPGDVQLFIQDQANDTWEGVNYNTIISPNQTRAFKVSKVIRDHPSSVLFGIKWTADNESEWVQIEKVEVFEE
ncbi:hypothetical protein [Rossellomorea aquimaris]|uniref:hypothetical protein n=1 Tax=Rossellomorea aquimaris TaxID=189382 RepID=UPI0007D09710|nr:hypothetical protein [Rossellomorea aquimaris]